MQIHDKLLLYGNIGPCKQLSRDQKSQNMWMYENGEQLEKLVSLEEADKLRSV